MTDYFWDNIFKGDRKEKSVLTALKNNILFKDLTLGELKLVQNIINVRNYQKGEVVFHYGEAGVGMYIIVTGSVDISLNGKFLTKLKEGDFFGEIALVEENGRRTADTISAEESVMIGFFKPDLMEIINRNPTAGVKILFRLAQVLGTRLLETTTLISNMRRDAKLNDQKNP